MKKVLISVLFAVSLASCTKSGNCDLHSGIFGQDDAKKVTFWTGNITLKGMTCEECEAKRDALREMNGQYPVYDIRDGRIVSIKDVIYCEKR